MPSNNAKLHKVSTMTQNQFIELCESLSIAPNIALESDALYEALQSRDDAAVVRILTEEF